MLTLRDRGYLPHVDNSTLYQFVTWSLATPELRSQGFLTRPDIATLIRDALRFFDGQRYRLIAWAIMPDHVHVLVELYEPYTLPQILHSWKSFTAHKINALLGRSGRLWEKESYDRYIRSHSQFQACIDYIHQNPVRAGFVKFAEDYEWSSARGFLTEECPPEAGAPQMPQGST